MEIEMELQQRIEEEGFEIAFNPPGDGSCFYRAAAFQLGFKSEILHNLIESHQFDVSYVILPMCKWLRDKQQMMAWTTSSEQKTNGVKLNIFRGTRLYISPLSQSSFHYTLELIFSSMITYFFYSFEPNQSLPPSSEVQLIAAACMLWRCSWQSTWEAVFAAFW